jgi:hypothetical protein
VIVSGLCWDFLTWISKRRYGKPGLISTTGFVVGEVSKDYRPLFDACQQTTFSCEHAAGYFFEPRAHVHEYFNRTNAYFTPTTAISKALGEELSDLADSLAQACGHYWRVVSFRLFSLRDGINSGAVHVDGWPTGLKKLFIYPNGANREIGTTYIRTRSGDEVVLDLPPRSWLLFENSVVMHQAVLPTAKSGNRQTIEIDIAPSLVTDPRLVDAGINGWYPWFPWNKQALEFRLRDQPLGLQ